MIKEAIEKIVDVSAAGRQARVFTVPSEPSDVYFLQSAEGVVDKRWAERSPRGFVADSIDGIVSISGVLRRRDGVITYFVGGDQVRIEAESDNGRLSDSASVALQRGEAYRLLCEAESKLAGRTQAEMVWLLRTSFASAVTPATLLATVRKLRIKTSADGTSEIQHGRASMGKAVHHEAAGADSPLPEEITVTCAVWEAVSINGEPLPDARVTCALDINLEEGTFTLRPLPGAIRQAANDARRWIADRIAAVDQDAKVIVDAAPAKK